MNQGMKDRERAKRKQSKTLRWGITETAPVLICRVKDEESLRAGWKETGQAQAMRGLGHL